VHSLQLVSANDPTSQPLLVALDRQMADYYNRPEIAAYYAQSYSSNTIWRVGSEHDAIRRSARAGMSVVDLGCGSAHSFVNLVETGVRYTGVDISERQMRANRDAYEGRAGNRPTFVAAALYDTGLPDNHFDLTFSTYVLEHLVWPHRFLREAVRVTRPGGRIMILCPHFRPAGRMPSFRYGQTVATLKQRLQRGRFLAAARHLYLRNVRYPAILRREYPPEQFRFLINLRPSCFEGPYYPDNDAVYLTDRREIVAELARLGAIDETAKVLADLDIDAEPGSCITITRKQSPSEESGSAGRCREEIAPVTDLVET
jgi:ubiquinone/menaquinone biosynthesis C-methylase UbiE